MLPHGMKLQSVQPQGFPDGIFYYVIQSTYPFLKPIVMFEEQIWTMGPGHSDRTKLTVVDEDLQKRMIIGRLVDVDEIYATYNAAENEDA